MPLDEGQSELDVVEVLVGDIDMFYDALTRAHNFSFANDLVTGYQELRGDAKRSKLTNVLARACNRVEAYMPQEEENGIEDQD